jgi:hypothetical protein
VKLHWGVEVHLHSFVALDKGERSASRNGRFPPRETLCCRLRLKCDDTRAETRFCLSAKRTSPFKSAGASVQSTTGSRGVRISGNDAGYTMFRGSVRVLATHSIRQFPLHFPSRASPCAITFQLDSTLWMGGWVGQRAGLDDWNTTTGLPLSCPAPSLVTIPTEECRFQKTGLMSFLSWLFDVSTVRRLFVYCRLFTS